MAIRPKGILFDLDNTLVDRDGAFARWLETLELDTGDRRRVLAADDSGYQGPEAACALIGERLGITAAEAWEQMRWGVVANVLPSAAISAVVRRLAGSLPVAVVTNGGADNQRAKMRAAELDDVFGPRVVTSEEVGAAKPAAAMFARGLELIGCDASEAVFVGDDPRADVDGARAAGMACVWVARGRSRSLTRATCAVDSAAELGEVICP